MDDIQEVSTRTISGKVTC